MMAAMARKRYQMYWIMLAFVGVRSFQLNHRALYWQSHSRAPISRILQQRGEQHSTRTQWTSISRAATFPYCRNQPSKALSATASLNVALEQPLLDLFGTVKPVGRGIGGGLFWKCRNLVLGSFRILCLAAAFLTVSYLVLQSVSGTSSSDLGNLPSNLERLRRRVMESIADVFDLAGPEPVAMPFDDAEADGWGVCTLRSKERYGATSFYRYVFDLPSPAHVLPIELGETVNLCCVDRNEQAVQAEFHPFQPDPRARPGSFSILVPDPSIAPLVLADEEIGRNSRIGSFSSWNDVQQSKVVQVIENDLQIGDEIAIQPSGESRLQYRGRHEVTDILYIAVGAGIAPVLDQMRAILPEDSSIPSAKSLSVVYINDASDDFDVTAELLENEYKKHGDKLSSVDCVVMDYMADPSRNKEINDAVPTFRPGTMAVLAGPSATIKKTVAFLIEKRGFPRECICVL